MKQKRNSNTYKKNIWISVLLGFFLFFCVSSSASAIYLDKTVYELDSSGSVPIIAVDPATDGLLVLYKLNEVLPLLSFDSYYEGFDLNYSRIIDGNYSIIELSPSAGDDFFCAIPEQELTYEDCKSLSGFVNEFLFTVLPGQYDSGNGSNIPTGVAASTPQVNISSPREGVVTSGKVPIVYSVFDQVGLVSNPISIFYTDSLNGLSSNSENINLIAKDLPNTGTYTWDSVGLSESKFYYILIKALNTAGVVGEAVSGFFNVDLTPPTFTVTANPPVVKEENVVINIKSSEKLSNWPTVSVRQRGGKSTTVYIHEKKDSYEGTYKAVKGFDGTAVIEISGTDMAGNIGTTIVGGGTFNVGVNPPPKPTIVSPVNNEKVTSSIVDIRGNTREDTEIVAKVNGKEIYKATPDEKGDFVIKNVSLNKGAKNGLNVINIVAIDRAGASSEALVYNILFNSAPSVNLLRPEVNSILSGTVPISVKASDDNGDLVYFRYEIVNATSSLKGEESWQKIADTPKDTVLLDTTRFVDGNYFLRVVADDGATPTKSEPLSVRIRNESSFFIRFYDGLHTTVNTKIATIRGVVYAQKDKFAQPTIKSLEYSIDSGKTWVKVSSQDGSFDSPQESFEVVFKNLKDGINDVIWRTTDSKGVTIRSNQPIVVDTVIPEPPEILFPDVDAVLTRENNETLEKGKFVFTLRGRAEYNTTVHVDIDGKNFIGQVSLDGTFRIQNINLTTRGKHSLKAFTTDEALNKSTTTEYSFIYDNPPSVIFTNPSNGRGLGGVAVLSWISGDLDGGQVFNEALSYREIGKPFIVLANNLKENKFTWDTTKLSEGNKYELSLTTNDGVISSNTTVPFSIDRTSPRLTSLNMERSTYKSGGVLVATGQAEDSGSGILFVEYQFAPINFTQDDAVTWYKAKINQKSLGKMVSFRIENKIALADGEYNFIVRAIDVAGNTSEEKVQKIIIDGTAPRVGSFDILSQGVRVLPEYGIWSVPKGENININLSLEQGTKSASIFIDQNEIVLTKNLATPLWEGEFMLDQTGEVKVFISATDESGNTVDKKLLVILQVKEKMSEESIPATHWWDFIFRML